MDRHYYAEHALTIACHPSETAERMMVRVLAFALNASERLGFGRGLSDADEPDVVETDLTGVITHWIMVGQPDARAVLKACGRAGRVSVYPYTSAAAKWWGDAGPSLARARNLTVTAIDADAGRDLARLAARSMDLQCTIQDGEVWLRSLDEEVRVALTAWR